MSPLRRRGGGRPRTAHSVLDLAERWGISEKSARRLAMLNLSEDALAVMAADCRRYAAGQRRRVDRRGKCAGGMRAAGMRSRLGASGPLCAVRA